MTTPSPPPDLEGRLERIEARLDQIHDAVRRSNGLLIGWEAISAACGKRPRTLRTYLKYGFPVYRFGARVASSVPLIGAWLTEVDLDRMNGRRPTWKQLARKKLSA
jgi:hypothetical protein